MTNINEEIAKKLGWTDITFSIYNRSTGNFPGFVPEKSVYNNEPTLLIPDYFHSIEAAWEIVDYLANKGLAVQLRQQKNFVHCEITRAEGVSDWREANAETAPLAICKAFLALKEIQ
jgi:hypothetical protein